MTVCASRRRVRAFGFSTRRGRAPYVIQRADKAIDAPSRYRRHHLLAPSQAGDRARSSRTQAHGSRFSIAGRLKRSLLPLRLHGCSNPPLRSCSPNTARLAQPPARIATGHEPPSTASRCDTGNACVDANGDADASAASHAAAETTPKHPAPFALPASTRAELTNVRRNRGHHERVTPISAAHPARARASPRRFNATSSTRPPRPRHKKRIPVRFRVRGSSDTATAAGPRAGACRAALMQPRPSASSAHVPSRARWPALPGTNALRP